MKQDIYFDTFDTVLGEFSVAVDPSGAILATAFGDEAALATRLSGAMTRDATRLVVPRAQIVDFLSGKSDHFDLPLAAQGSVFQHQVWAELCAIPLGETRTYGEIAASLKRPSAARAVGRANATNPICVIVPCHRVISRTGSLHGFAFGQTIKRALLKREGVVI